MQSEDSSPKISSTAESVGQESQANAQQNRHNAPQPEMQAYEPEDYDMNIDDNAMDANVIDDEALGLASDRFTTKPEWNDVPYALFFGFTTFIFVIVSMKNIIKHGAQFKKETPLIPGASIDLGLTFGMVFLLLVVFLLSVFIAMSIFFLTGKSTHRITSIGFKIATYGCFVLGILNLIMGEVTGAIFVSLGVVSFYILKKYSSSLELAANVLTEALKVLKKYPSTTAFAFLSLVSVLLMEVLFYLAVGTTYIDHGFKGDGSHRLNEDGEDISKLTFNLIFTVLFVSFSKLYITDVIRNIVHTTIAGVYGSWYYMQNTFAGMPAYEGVGSLKRACTYNLGSICCGSLFVVLFQCVATAIQVAHLEEVGVVGQIFILLFTIVAAFVGYFNLYVYSYVGIYGANIFKSFKVTSSFIRQRGWYAFRKDFIVVASLVSINIIAAIFSVIVTGLYLYLFGSIFGVRKESYPAIILFAYFTTFQVANVVTMTLLSGSASFFLSLNKDPAVFEESNPFEFQEISRCYPTVLDKLHLNQ